jgi:hypothetical protein
MTQTEKRKGASPMDEKDLFATEQDLVEGERLTSIYRTRVEFVRDDYPNGTVQQHDFLFAPGPDDTLENAQAHALDLWEDHLDATIKHGPCAGMTNLQANMQYTKLDTEFLRKDTWLLRWFFHLSLNHHLTDALLLTSFFRYLGRVARFNRANGHGEHDHFDLDNKQPFICVMGANDLWRWKGPCRCQECVKNGLTRIDH